MEWLEKLSSDAKVAYLLTLTEKMMHQIEKYHWYGLARNVMDMCWEWLEEKKHHGDELYLRIDNDVDGLGHIKGVAFVDDQPDPQEKALWFCVTQVAFYATWQAYEYEGEEYVPQAVESTDDEAIDWFMESMRKADEYQEEWSERLKEYLLHNYPAGSSKKIKREELLKLI
jgi:Immunity protein Imm6